MGSWRNKPQPNHSILYLTFIVHVDIRTWMYSFHDNSAKVLSHSNITWKCKFKVSVLRLRTNSLTDSLKTEKQFVAYFKEVYWEDRQKWQRQTLNPKSPRKMICVHCSRVTRPWTALPQWHCLGEVPQVPTWLSWLPILTVAFLGVYATLQVVLPLLDYHSQLRFHTSTRHHPFGFFFRGSNPVVNICLTSQYMFGNVVGRPHGSITLAFCESERPNTM